MNESALERSLTRTVIIVIITLIIIIAIAIYRQTVGHEVEYHDLEQRKDHYVGMTINLRGFAFADPGFPNTTAHRRISQGQLCVTIAKNFCEPFRYDQPDSDSPMPDLYRGDTDIIGASEVVISGIWRKDERGYFLEVTGVREVS